MTNITTKRQKYYKNMKFLILVRQEYTFVYLHSIMKIKYANQESLGGIQMIKTKKVLGIILVFILLLPNFVLAIQTIDNGVYKIYPVTGNGFEFNELKGFNIQAYIEDERTSKKTLVGSTFGDYGYLRF